MVFQIENDEDAGGELSVSNATVSGLLFGRSRQAAHEAVPLALYADCGVI
jgi:hypothetical protein